MGRLSRFWAHRKRWRDSRLAVVLAIAIAPFSVVVANLVSPHMRVGDGSEYYALYLSWIATARPYLSPALASTYGEMLASKQIIGLHVPFDAFAKAVPHLLVGSTQDVNHFWFYSGLAALIGIVTPFGSLTDPTNAFIALHVLLALAATTIAFYLFRWPGLIAVTLILVASPAIWFANKVHTEYFTITLTSIAVLSLLGRRFTWSVLALALAATQNPSFAVGAVIIGLLWLTDLAQRPTKLDAALVGLASVTVILHPLYYFSRHGGFTPQLFGSGATTDLSSVRHFYIWLLDLDVGLLPNWPLGILLLLLGLHAIPRFRFEGGWRAIVALVTLFVIDLAANSMTVNLNSGATVDVARYGTWYLCFFLPFAITWLRTENEFGCSEPLSTPPIRTCRGVSHNLHVRIPALALAEAHQADRALALGTDQCALALYPSRRDLLRALRSDRRRIHRHRSGPRLSKSRVYNSIVGGRRSPLEILQKVFGWEGADKNP